MLCDVTAQCRYEYAVSNHDATPQASTAHGMFEYAGLQSPAKPAMVSASRGSTRSAYALVEMDDMAPPAKPPLTRDITVRRPPSPLFSSAMVQETSFAADSVPSSGVHVSMSKTGTIKHEYSDFGDVLQAIQYEDAPILSQQQPSMGYSRSSQAPDMTSRPPAMRLSDPPAVSSRPPSVKLSQPRPVEYSFGDELHSAASVSEETAAMAKAANFIPVPFSKAYNDAFDRDKPTRSSASSATSSTHQGQGYLHIEAMEPRNADLTANYKDLTGRPPYFHGKLSLSDATSRLTLGRKPNTFLVFEDDTCMWHLVQSKFKI